MASGARAEPQSSRPDSQALQTLWTWSCMKLVIAVTTTSIITTMGHESKRCFADMKGKPPAANHLEMTPLCATSLKALQ